MNPTAARRQLGLLLGAKTLSDMGFALDFICFNTFVWIATQSPFAAGCLAAALYGGGAIGGRVVQLYGNAWDRRRVMVWADLARLAALVALAALPPHLTIYWLYPTVLCIGIARAIFTATLSASLPAMSGPRLQTINGLVSGLRGVALVIGMTVAALYAKTFGFRALFLFDALTYGLSAAVLWRTTLPFRDTAASSAAAPPAPPLPWHAIRALGAGIWLLMLIRALDALGSGTQHVGFPMLGAALNPADPARAIGQLWGVWGVGMFLGSFVLRPFLATPMHRNPHILFLLATVGMSAGFTGIFWSSGWPMLLGWAILAGAGDGLSEIAFRQTLQQAPDTLRGSLFGCAEILVNGGLILGLLFTGTVVTPATIPHWTLILHGIPIAACAAGFTWHNRLRTPRPHIAERAMASAD